MQKIDTHKAFVAGYQHDVFISYAHIDDEPLAGADKGWVTTFAKNLEIFLTRKLGSKRVSIWVDHMLAGHAPLTPAIINALHATATLLVIVSRGYLASEWCRKERNEFLRLIENRIDSGARVFLVECDKVGKSELPSEFGDLLGYRFWVEDSDGQAPRTLGTPIPRPEEQEYYTRLNNLSHELALELERLKRAEESQSVIDLSVADSSASPTIFLAEVTDDLYYHREDIKGYLLQAGLDVLPKKWYPHDDLTAYQEALDGDLSQCKLFVQLLSNVSGRRPPNWPQGYAGLQYERAKQAAKPILQWRSRDLDLSDIKDAAHQELLEAETVCATGIEEFKRAIVEEANRRPEPAPRPNGLDLIFVNTDSNDRKLAEEVSRFLLKYGIGSMLPLIGGEPSEIRKDLEANLQDCDGLIIVYGKTSVSWVRNQLRQTRKMIGQRDRPLRCLAVFEGPPPEKDELAFLLPHLHNLNCRNGLSDSALLEFIECLGGRSK